MKRFLAAGLILALCIGALSTAALAEEQSASSADQALIADASASSDEGAAGSQETGEEAPTDAAADDSVSGETAADGAQQNPEEQTPAGTPDVAEPDAVGTLSWANLEKRVRENNYTIHALDESIESINAIDFDKQRQRLLDQLNQIASMQHMVATLPSDALAGTPLEGMTFSSLQSTYASLESAFDDLASGKTQRTMDGTVRQLRNAEDQLVQGAQSMYVALLEMKSTRTDLQRQLAALERTEQEMKLRYQLGQVSAMTLQQVTSGRAQMEAGIATLEKNISDYTAQLQLMVGAEITGSMTLTEVPEVTDTQIEKMAAETDLEGAKTASYELLAAQLTLNDAEDDWKDAKDQYNKSRGTGTFTRSQRNAAEHSWQAAQYTYQAAVQSYELRFHTMFSAVADCRSKLTAQNTALEVKRDACRTAELKYSQGTISKNDLLSAQDDLAAAEKDVLTAKHDLFTAYNTYCWARDHGLLN